MTGGSGRGGDGNSGHGGRPGHPGGSSDCPPPEGLISLQEFIAQRACELGYVDESHMTAQDSLFASKDWRSYRARHEKLAEQEAALRATAELLAGLLVSTPGAAILPIVGGDAATSAPTNSAPNRSALCSPARPGALAVHACRRGAQKHLSLFSEPRALSLQHAGTAARPREGVRPVRHRG